jgi:hypothetical protein
MTQTTPSGQPSGQTADSQNNNAGQNTAGQNTAGQNAVGQNAVGQNAVGQKPADQPAVDKEATVDDYILSDADKFWSGEIDLNLEPLKEGQSYYKNKVSSEELIKRAPPVLRQMLSNLRSDYTRKTQEAAAAKAAAEAKYAQAVKIIEQDRHQIKKLAEFKVDPLMTEDNVWNNKVPLQEYINYIAAKKNAESFQYAANSWEQEQRLNSFREFKASKPEFQKEGFDDKVADYIEKGLSLEDAYIVAKSKLPPETEEVVKENYNEFLQRNNKETQQRDLLSKMSASGRSTKGFIEVPKGTPFSEVNEMIKEYKKLTGKEPKIKRI